jgi:hypothetical protein
MSKRFAVIPPSKAINKSEQVRDRAFEQIWEQQRYFAERSQPLTSTKV